MSDKGVYVDDPEYVEDDEDLEYKVFTIKFEQNHLAAAVGQHQRHDSTIAEWLNAGWHLYNWLVCRPFIMLFFSREKEGDDESPSDHQSR